MPSAPRTRTPLLPATAIGLSPPAARARYRVHTMLMVGLFLVSWAVYLRLNLDAMASSIRLATAPAYTATVRPPDPGTSAPILVWTDDDGAIRFGVADPGDPYRPGEHVRVLEYSSSTCWTWETDNDRGDDLFGMVVFLFALPAGMLAGYLAYRRVRWSGLLGLTLAHRRAGHVTGTYRLGHRTGLTVDVDGRTVYVPLLRDQFVTALPSFDALVPVNPDHGRTMVFRVAGTDRIVWPAGRCRTRLLPVAGIAGVAVHVLWVAGPPLLTLAVRLFTAPITPC